MENSHNKMEILDMFKLVTSEMEKKSIKVTVDKREYVATPPQFIMQGVKKDLFFKPNPNPKSKKRKVCNIIS